MDRIDEQIMQLLKENSRITSSEISKQVHLSVPAVSERIRKLEDCGIIDQFTIKINREQLGLHLIAFIMVELEKTEHIAGFRETILQTDSVLECHHLAGSYDYLLKVAVKGTAELEWLISDKLKRIEGVSKTNTMIALSTMKEEL
ncbi:AsnC family transcriptional regulator [Brevibacillus reuszeri]|uniref:Transcriptional regulator n=1 Tax=Brevibacillus reuszeri TaxID=54915 RepID=A0A0K9YJ19_9BACL|nr:Lrp/AsnC family transcriptional regulator [Brevibacillus reuszeri]KNB68697.1 transcriptional regulator [Brevibacillus reuszeri]MED1858988.1 Lrp/AsnC family transcriptional regulator [Brevibacillus reuszeri]GED69205.1 AsnC family transcriptional regulator [Brevibacillus reuszeri]